MKNINFLDHPYWIPKCLNIGRISIPLQIFSYIYFPKIFTEIGWMFENVKIPIDHHAIFLFCPFQNLLILSHLSESVDVPAGCTDFVSHAAYRCKVNVSSDTFSTFSFLKDASLKNTFAEILHLNNLTREACRA